jgi:hypothetical protein
VRRVFAIALVVVSLQLARHSCGSSDTSRNRGDHGRMESPRQHTRVRLSRTMLEYFEDENRLVLDAEPARDRRGNFYYIVYVPTPERWVRTMADWSRYRRDEILTEIKRLTEGRPIKWADYD